MSRATKQDLFAANLEGLGLGTAIYHPIQFREHSGRVGDIAPPDSEGSYKTDAWKSWYSIYKDIPVTRHI